MCPCQIKVFISLKQQHKPQKNTYRLQTFEWLCSYKMVQLIKPEPNINQEEVITV